MRIGIAISDESGALARPFSILKHISREEDAKRILELAENEACEVILIESPMTALEIQDQRLDLP